jgi:hypothetical protein
VLSSLKANVAGRTGADLLLTLQGSDPSANSYGLYVQLEDQAGNPVIAFDGDWNGMPSVAERSVLFDQTSAVGLKTFTRTVTLSGFMQQFPGIANVVGALEDASGLKSNEATAPVTAQAVRAMTEGCDPSVIVDRCGPNLGCSGTPPVCTPATPPQLTQFAYVPAALGPQMLFLGTDPADDISTIHIEFLDGSGQPVMVDLTGNMDFAASFDINVDGWSTLGHFFYVNQAAQGFDSMVPQLAATPSGSNSDVGPRVTARLSTALAGGGAACDPRGFTGCTAGYSCMPAPSGDGGAGTKNVCAQTSTARATISKVAPVLDPAKGSVFATGYTQTPSLWDPPVDCVAPGIRSFPQGVALLHLSRAVADLTITTANPETNFDTVLYVLPGTGGMTGGPLGCNDNTTGYTSTLSLSNAAAGDYTIVIGSATPEGGNYGVSIR